MVEQSMVSNTYIFDHFLGKIAAETGMVPSQLEDIAYKLHQAIETGRIDADEIPAVLVSAVGHALLFRYLSRLHPTTRRREIVNILLGGFVGAVNGGLLASTD